MARPPRPWYARGAWRTDFGGERNKVLVIGPKNSETKLRAEKALLELREQVKLLHNHPGMNTPIAVVVERFLDDYVDRVVYQDYRNELNWFMGADVSRTRGVDGRKNRRGENRLSGGRFGFPCKSWPISRINADLVEKYLRRRKAARLGGFHAYTALRTLMDWARRKRYIASHDLDLVDRSLRKRGRRRYLPQNNEDVFRAFRAADGKFREFLFVLMHTGMRPKEIQTVLVGEFEREQRQLVLKRHKVIEKTGLPKVVPLPTDELVEICRANAEGRSEGEPLFLTDRKRAWTYQAIRLRWKRLREKLGIDPRFTLYTFRHWYVTMGIEDSVDAALMSELAGHADPSSIKFYNKMRNHRLHEGARQVADAIERAGIRAAPHTSKEEDSVPD
jgi:site-specific recombinase XerD